jgi:photosystem II stability/assembly factor-like uncharacterized protein
MSKNLASFINTLSVTSLFSAITNSLMEAACGIAQNWAPEWRVVMKKGAVRFCSVAITTAFILAMWVPGQCWAQNNNVEFVHPPVVSPTKPVDDSLHPPPSPFSQPESTVTTPGVRQSLPVRMPFGGYYNDEDRLNPLLKDTRPMDELQREIDRSLGMPSEPQGIVPALPRLQSSAPTTSGWSQIGTGIWNNDGVHLNNGRIRQASYAYDNAQGFTTLWLGATGGGLWKALGGVVFVPVSDTLPGSPSVGAFLVQPGNSNNILIGSGDLGRFINGTGMYKTTDGGTTWHPVSPSDGTGWPYSFQKILIDVSDSSNQTVIAQGDPGIWRSTDFGDTWTQVYSGSATDLVQDTVHPWIWYAGAPGIGVVRSTTYGRSFAPIGTGIAAPVWRVAVALSMSAPWHVYAMTANGGYLSGIWRSDNYGDNWTNIRAAEGPTTPPPLFSGVDGGQAGHTTSLAVDPDNADLVFAGMAGMLVTANGTASAPTWEHCEIPGSRCTDDGHSDHTDFVFESGTNNVLGTGDGGVYVFNKATLKIAGNLNYGNNLSVEQVFGDGDLACSRIRPDFCLAGLQDNGLVSPDRMSNPVMTELYGGDGTQVSISPDTDWLFGMEVSSGRIYSTDGGSNWTGNYGSCLPFDAYATTMVDQTPNRPVPYIYTVAGSYIWFKPVDPNCGWFPANIEPLPVGFAPVHLDVSNDPNGYVFYVTGWSSGKLYVADSYSDGKLIDMTYEDRTPPLPAGSSLNGAGIIAADRSSLRPYTVTYTTSGARPARAYISNDRGLHWADVTGDLPDGNYIKLIANPKDQKQMFLSTDMGVYRTDNGGVNWYRYMNGLPAVVHVMGMELNSDSANPPLLHIGTFGRGFWDREVTPDVVLQSVSVNPTRIIGGKPMDLLVSLDRDAITDVTVSLSSSDPTIFPVPSSVTIPAGYHNAGISVSTAQVTRRRYVTVTATYNEVQTATELLLPKDPSSTSVISSLNPSAFGQAVTFTATVTSPQGTPDGYVLFQDAGSTIVIASLSGGKATLDDPYLSVGVHSITAVYEGSTTFLGSTSPAISHTVNKAATSVSLVSSANLHPIPFGQNVSFTATVSASTTGIPEGTITLKDGPAVLATKVVNINTGTVMFVGFSTFSVGNHVITATYNGNGSYLASVSPILTLVISRAASATSVVSSVNPSSLGQTVTFTATVKSSTSGIPTGSVTFKNGTTTLGTSMLASGKASIATSKLSKGTHSISVVYGGSVDYFGSTSQALSQTVN